MEPTLLGNCLKSLAVGDWQLEQLVQSPKSPWGVMKFSTERRVFRFHVAEVEGWLLAQCVIPVHFDLACRAAVSQFLLELNHHLRLVKFAFGDGGLVHASVEQPMSDWDCARLGQILNGLRLCCRQYYREIELLAQEPRLAEVFQSLRQQDLGLRGADIPVSVLSVANVRDVV